MIAVIDDLPIFRLLAQRLINHAKDALAPYCDTAVLPCSSVPEFLFWVNTHDHAVCELLLLDYTLASGETSATCLPELLQNPKLAQSIIVGWSRTNESACNFRHHGAHGFISKDRSGLLVTDIMHIIQQYHAGMSWIEMW